MADVMEEGFEALLEEQKKTNELLAAARGDKSALKEKEQKKRAPRLGIFRYRKNRLVSSASLPLLSFGASYSYSEPR